MNEFIIYTLIQTFVTFPFAILVLWLVFRRKLILKLIFTILPGVYYVTIMSFFIGKFGQIHILWVAPSSTVVFVIIFKYLLDMLQNPITDLVTKLDDISKGKLGNKFADQKVQKRNDEIGLLYTSVQNIDENLLQIIKRIKEISISVFNAGLQLSSMSTEIAKSASIQADNTEKVSLAMRKMINAVNSNTGNAEMTKLVTTKSANKIKRSNEIFQETINSVLYISQKITIISEIAKKTDLLSINASIEAARAGEKGKGFAVVAQEIRKLADKTKKASVEIEQLSISGQEISKMAGKNLEETIPEIIKSAELVSNIVNASKEQGLGIETINTSIEYLTEITNQNSSSAEEMSTTAENLSQQAKQLKKMISFFDVE